MQNQRMKLITNVKNKKINIKRQDPQIWANSTKAYEEF